MYSPIATSATTTGANRNTSCRRRRANAIEKSGTDAMTIHVATSPVRPTMAACQLANGCPATSANPVPTMTPTYAPSASTNLSGDGRRIPLV